MTRILIQVLQNHRGGVWFGDVLMRILNQNVVLLEAVTRDPTLPYPIPYLWPPWQGPSIVHVRVGDGKFAQQMRMQLLLKHA